MPARQLRAPDEDPFGALAELATGMTPDELRSFADTLDADDLGLLEQALGSRLTEHWRATPDAMMEKLTAGERKRWPFVQLLGRKFAQAVTGEDPLQIWNLPPQYGKSTLASQWGPAWALDRDPTTRIILTSYGDDLVKRNALAVRDILDTHSATLRTRLRRDQRRQDRFSTDQGGGVLAASIRSGMTGFPADGIVIDDPLKDWQEAHSAARRSLVVNQYRSVIRARKPKWIILVMTRWHEEDLTGWLMEQMAVGTGEPFTLVRLPAIAEAPSLTSSDPVLRMADPLGRAPGELLEPDRFDAAEVAATHLALGSYLTAGLEQQRPAPEEGGELKRAWWRLDDAMPTNADQWLTSWDMKLKDKESGDYVVGGTWARTGKDAWLTDVYRGQWGFATTVNAIALAAVRQPNARQHLVENTGNGPEVIEELRKARPGYEVSEDIAGQLGMTVEERAAVNRVRRRGLNGVVPVNPKGDKKARARAQAPSIEAGDVHLHAGASWLGSFLDETAAFPTGAHDDQVDMMSQALSRLSRGAAVAKAPEGRVPSSRRGARAGGAPGVAVRARPRVTRIDRRPSR